MKIETLAAVYLAAVNFFTFLAYGSDKQKAKLKKWRTPERVLILLAAIGGSVGALLGMKIFHHKTKHKKFTIGVPLILIAQIVAALLLFYFHN